MKVDKWIKEGFREPSIEVEGKLFALIIVNMVEIVISKHFFTIGGELCRQEEGDLLKVTPIV